MDLGEWSRLPEPQPLSDEQRTVFETDILGIGLDTCETLFQRLGEMPGGLLVIVSAKGARIIRVPMPQDFAVRTAVAETCRNLILADHATAYLFAFEFWLRTGSAEDLKKPQPNYADLPDSKEGVMICGQTSEGSFGSAFDIVRSRRGAFKKLRPHDHVGGYMQFTGIWTDLLYRQQAS